MIQSEYRLLCRIVTSFDQTSANYSADSVVNEYHRLSKDLTLCATMHRLIAQMRINQQWCTAHNYQSTLNSLMRFRHQFDLPIDRLDVAPHPVLRGVAQAPRHLPQHHLLLYAHPPRRL